MATTNFNWTSNTGADFEIEANTSFEEIDASMSDVLSVSVTSTNAATISAENFRANSVFVIDEDLSDPAYAAILITVPNTKRGFFSIVNNTAFAVDVEISGQARTAPSIGAGTIAILVTDGANIMKGA